MKNHWSLILFLLLSALAACTERIDIRLGETYTRLVVDGSITTDTIKHRVKLLKSSDYFFNKPPVMVTGADVRISDGLFPEVLMEESPGVYSTGPSFAGVPGRTYTLDITLAEEVGGYRAYSARSALLPVAVLDSIALAFHSDWGPNGIWEIKSYLQDPPTRDYYRIMISKNSALLTDTLDEWYVTDDLFFNGNYTNGAPIGYLVQDYHNLKILPGDTITAEINGIGKDYASFIQQAQTELFGSNPLFSGPSANIKGNITNGAIGFFAAYSVTRARAIIPVR